MTHWRGFPTKWQFLSPHYVKLIGKLNPPLFKLSCNFCFQSINKRSKSAVTRLELVDLTQGTDTLASLHAGSTLSTRESLSE